jgi:hypothetical protein
MNGAAAACTFVIYVPSPIKYFDTVKEPLTFIEPLNIEPLLVDSTKNPYSGATEAVTLPLAILNASPLNAERGMLNNPSPEPEKYPEPEGIVTLPLILILPVNLELILLCSWVIIRLLQRR